MSCAFLRFTSDDCFCKATREPEHKYARGSENGIPSAACIFGREAERRAKLSGKAAVTAIRCDGDSSQLF